MSLNYFVHYIAYARFTISMMTWSVPAVLYVVQHVPDFIVWTEVIVHQLYDN